MVPIFDGREMMVRTLTMLTARDVVKAQLRAQGYTLLHYKASELTAMAKAYLADNQAELVEQTEQQIMATPAFRVIWETEGSPFGGRLRVFRRAYVSIGVRKGGSMSGRGPKGGEAECAGEILQRQH
jgi:hypothetical protein